LGLVERIALGFLVVDGLAAKTLASALDPTIALL
jgi:hypothetical protein